MKARERIELCMDASGAFCESMETDNLIVIRKKDSEDDRMFIVERDKFEHMNLCDCYNEFGFQIGATDAGNYCLENCYCTGLREKFLNDFKSAGFEVEEDNCIDDILESEDEKVQKFLEDWREENESYTEALVYNFWNGHNWQSIILDCDIDEGVNYEEIESEEAEEILKAFEGVEFGQYKCGLRSVEVGDLVFTHSLFAGDPFLASVA